MSRTKRHLAAFAIVAACLTACDGTVFVTRSEGVSNYNADTYVQTLAQNGTNAVVVQNNPFGPAGDQAILTALQSRYSSGQYRFALGPTATDWNGYTVVLGFGQPIGNQTQCAAPNAPRAVSTSGQTILIGDYCFGNRVITEATGYTGSLTGPDDPTLGKLAAEVFAELVINRPPKSNGDGNDAVTH